MVATRSSPVLIHESAVFILESALFSFEVICCAIGICWGNKKCYMFGFSYIVVVIVDEIHVFFSIVTS